MKAFIIKNHDSAHSGQIEEVELPVLDPNKIRVKVKAASINHIDIERIKKTANKLGKSFCAGVDFAGDVAEIGDNVSMFSPGQRVAGLVNNAECGSFAEYVDVDPDALFIIPDGVCYKEAAAMAYAGVIAWKAINEKVVIPHDSFIYITAGGFGVGNYLIQLATKRGTKPITAAEEDGQTLYKLGIEHIIDPRKISIPERVKEITLGEGVKTVIDFISPKSASENIDLLCYNGAIVTIWGRLHEYPYEPKTKAITVSEVALDYLYASGCKKALKDVSKAGESLVQLIAKQEFNPMIEKTYPFADIEKAFEEIPKNGMGGKYVIEM